MKQSFFVIPLFFLLISCKVNLQSPTYGNIERFKLTKISTEGAEGEVDISIFNPNSFSFTVYQAKAEATFAGVKLGRAAMKKKFRIPANSGETHTLYLKTKFKEMQLPDLGKLLSGKLGMLELSGHIKAGKWFFKKRFDLSREQRISIFK